MPKLSSFDSCWWNINHFIYSVFYQFYRDSHGYQLGTGPLPITISQLEEKPAIDPQQSTTKCHICDTNFKDLETLFLHKSLHVNPKVIY